MPRILFLAALAAVILTGCTKHTDTRMSPPPLQWPSLAAYSCTAGRAATTNDVAADRAVFVLEADGRMIGQPLAMTVPQYAFHIDEQTHHRTPCVIIQAEEARGQKLIGCRTLPDGKTMAALYREFELLGETPPKSQ
jgi:hypothetical protein